MPPKRSYKRKSSVYKDVIDDDASDSDQRTPSPARSRGASRRATPATTRTTRSVVATARASEQPSLAQSEDDNDNENDVLEVAIKKSAKPMAKAKAKAKSTPDAKSALKVKPTSLRKRDVSPTRSTKTLDKALERKESTKLTVKASFIDERAETENGNGTGSAPTDHEEESPPDPRVFLERTPEEDIVSIIEREDDDQVVVDHTKTSSLRSINAPGIAAWPRRGFLSAHGSVPHQDLRESRQTSSTMHRRGVHDIAAQPTDLSHAIGSRRVSTNIGSTPATYSSRFPGRHPLDQATNQQHRLYNSEGAIVGGPAFAGDEYVFPDGDRPNGGMFSAKIPGISNTQTHTGIPAQNYAAKVSTGQAHLAAARPKRSGFWHFFWTDIQETWRWPADRWYTCGILTVLAVILRMLEKHPGNRVLGFFQDLFGGVTTVYLLFAVFVIVHVLLSIIDAFAGIYQVMTRIKERQSMLRQRAGYRGWVHRAGFILGKQVCGIVADLIHCVLEPIHLLFTTPFYCQQNGVLRYSRVFYFWWLASFIRSALVALEQRHKLTGGCGLRRPLSLGAMILSSVWVLRAGFQNMLAADGNSTQVLHSVTANEPVSGDSKGSIRSGVAFAHSPVEVDGSLGPWSKNVHTTTWEDGVESSNHPSLVTVSILPRPNTAMTTMSVRKKDL